MGTAETTMTGDVAEERLALHRRLWFMILFLVFFFQAFFSFPADDGLRHVGLALRGEARWAEVYPFSGFSENAATSPWYGYDTLLSWMLSAVRTLGLAPALGGFLAIKIVSFVLAAALFLLVLQRSGIVQEIESFPTLLAATALMVALLAPLFGRAMLLRPFVFGTLFLAYSFSAKGLWKGLLSAGVLIFLYPYLSWFYILPTAFCHVLRGDRRFAAGILTPLGVFLALQPNSFWGLQLALISSGSVRSEMGLQISELRPISGSFYCLLILAGYLLFYPHLHRGRRKLLYGDLLAFAFLPPSVLYIRTFVDVLLPVLFITHARPFVPAVARKLLEIKTGWALFMEEANAPRPLRFLLKKWGKPRGEDRSGGGLSLKPLIGLLFALLIGIGVKANLDQLGTIRETAELLAGVPENAVVISSFNRQYLLLFVRPDLKIIPSSEAGLPAASIRNEYVAFFKEGTFGALARRTSAAFLIEGKDMYLDPGESRQLEQVAKNGGMRVWRILHRPGEPHGSIVRGNGVESPHES